MISLKDGEEIIPITFLGKISSQILDDQLLRIRKRGALTAIIDLDRKGKGQINIPTIEPEMCLINLKTYN